MTYKKYSKSSSFYLNTKKDFFETNDNLLKQALKYNQIYKEQNKRENCKICCFNLGNDYDIQNHNIGYIFCKKCNHLNGIYEDTENFIQKMYLDNEGRSYSNHYIDKNIKKRAEDI